jgi:hypothetical protein
VVLKRTDGELASLDFASDEVDDLKQWLTENSIALVD